MPITTEDLRDFSRFAGEKLDNGGANSLVELAREWEAQRGPTAVSLDVKIDANTARWLTEAFPDVNDEQRLQQALARRGGVTTAEMVNKAATAAKEAGYG